ncbi:MAG TPA: amidohydrolase family protein, partial [Thermoanaerobaculia bacterium]|nr:amidohydrolase family protein [Thermoanaerobaculia bacterium]
GAVPGNEDQLRPMLFAGALGFKCFLIDSGVPEFGHLDEAGLTIALQTLNGTGAPLLVHAELSGPIEEARPRGPKRTYRHYLESRPDAAEISAIELVVRKCEETGGRAHIVHLSAAGGLAVIRAARKRGLAISAETTPHYLHFESENVPDGATEYKCAPPIRDAENRERLWAGLHEGVIELIVSDHSPCTPGLKKLETGDFMAAWGGIASLQLVLPVVWTEARRRGYGLPILSEWLSHAPADLAGLHGRKGKLAAGYDADLVVWDPEATLVPAPSMIAHRHKLTPYLGETLRGVVIDTYLRGEPVFHEGLISEASGRWLRGRNE